MFRIDPISASRHLRCLIVIGTSTGGPQALTEVFKTLPAFPGTACCVVQHMPPKFTGNLARRLDSLCSWSVAESMEEVRVLPGTVWIARGGHQSRLTAQGGDLWMVSNDMEPVGGHCPSVDVLFHSVVSAWSGPLIGIVMTGMGRDGSAGLNAIKHAGGRTIAESEETSVIFGMPKASISLGAAERVVPLYDMATEITKIWNEIVPGT